MSCRIEIWGKKNGSGASIVPDVAIKDRMNCVKDEVTSPAAISNQPLARLAALERICENIILGSTAVSYFKRC